MAFYQSHFQVANVLGAESLHAAIKEITPPILNMADRVERLKCVMREQLMHVDHEPKVKRNLSLI